MPHHFRSSARFRPGRRLGRAALSALVALTGFALVTAAGVAPAHADLIPHGATGTTGTTGASDAGTAAVVVMATAEREQAVRHQAVALGLRITRQLPIVHGFAARGPSAAADLLGAVPGVVSVSPDRTMTPMSIVPSLGYDPADTGSPSAISQIVGAQQAWAAGYTGAGVDVAVIDTGVTPVAGLANAGQVITGPDLSLDAPGATTPGLDAFGHGTFMAGLIAGRDATATGSAAGCTTCLNSSGWSDTTKYVGMAPGARIVNVKVGAADGAADVSQVIAAIDWVTQHAHDPGLNIKVLSLSFGTQSTQAYTVDPLAQAAEQAWKHGIVVVAAAGNDGKKAPTLANPAYDPYVLAVGGAETNATPGTSDDSVPKFAEHGTSDRPVDVVAPATHVLGLRVPGSYIDTLSGNSGQVGTRFQRGSGTSEATATVSGLVALLAQKYPGATPDQLKALLKNTSTVLSKKGDAVLDAKTLLYAGHGIPNAGKAVATSLPAATLPTTTQTFAASTGLGTLDAARGGVYLVDNGFTLTGQKDIFGKTYSPSAMAGAASQTNAWTGGVWNGSRWSGDGWSGSRWSSGSWAGSRWSGVAWSSAQWSGSRWSGMAWDGSRWSGSGWSGSRWTGSTWTGSRWSSAGWN